MIKNEIEFILNDNLIKIKDIDTNVTVLNYLRFNNNVLSTDEVLFDHLLHQQKVITPKVILR